jgi:hypothetical protein
MDYICDLGERYPLEKSIIDVESVDDWHVLMILVCNHANLTILFKGYSIGMQMQIANCFSLESYS